ncbi:uncharacterized protein MEPE_06863 [Melanopsichium pennsylvanicum]|uniref:DUF221-domain-containing protein n=2 Tax=Melanopsichium pennsylvanicum TaxID=63383 RepID=A0AAJ4XU06_9BASI|nr:duf221-domain-containing protein [Melanopsichium pennsylvanicum 4]SNX88152.1 uncharacterized protein MEPE_06863 [Melanopsichium pennsylvanicum]
MPPFNLVSGPARLVLAVLLVQQAAAQEATKSSASTSTVISSIVLNAIILAIFFCVFLIFRPRFKRVYAPRTYLVVPEEQIAPLPSSLFGWLPVWLKTPTSTILEKNGLDAYMFVEYLEMMLWVFVPIWILSWIVLMPTYGANTTGTGSGFNRFILSRVGSTAQQQKRYVAPLLIQWIFTFWLLWNIRSRMTKFIKLRQEFLVSPQHASSAQARTVLITGIPNELLSEKKLRAIYSQLPGGVAKIWLNRNLKDLPDLSDERDKWCNKLESAETTLIKTAYKLVKKGKAQDASGSLPDADVEINAEVADHYVPKKKRPTHKLGSIPCMGEKVDTIHWCREEIARLNKEIEKKRSEIAVDYKNYPPQSSAFILFNTQIAAHMAVKSQAHHEPYRMTNRYVEAHPDDVVWANMNMNPYERKLRTAIGWAITVGLIIFWAVPVAFVGIISNINGIASKVSFLNWLLDIPTVVLGIIQGILPTVLLAVLNMLLPIFLRLLSRLSGVPTRSGIELDLQGRFAAFQIVQNFLFLTLISGNAGQIATYINDVAQNPGEFPGLLAEAIPKGSLFFLSFIALQGLSGASSLFAQLPKLAVYYVKKFLLASTPRKVWHIDHDTGGPAWGTLFPTITLITVIGTGYVAIAPIVNGFVAFTFFLFFLGYKYLFLYVYDTKPASETSGLFFGKAIRHIFAGLYVEMVMLTAIFFLTQSQEYPDGPKKQSAIPEGVFMVVLIVIVIGYHYFLNDSFKQLETALPLTLTTGSTNEALLHAGNERISGETAYNEKKALNGLGSSTVEAAPAIKGGANGNGYNADAPHHGKPHQDTGLTDEQEQAFYHPSLTGEQKPIWLPNDKFGIGRAGVASARKAGLDATCEHTSVTEKGQVETNAYEPPGEPLV